MPVTVPLSSRRGATRTRRHRAATRAVAVSAVVSASLGVLAAADQHSTTTSGHLTAGTPASADATQQVAFTAFTPREAQMPQIVPEAVVWEQNRFAVEAARPKTVRPIAGILTSTFGERWGSLHAGLDLADAIGTPIAAVTDGVVIEAGPASGFGMWVRVQQDDGTIGVYGHVNDILATVGQQVRAGDIIATVGNRGFSTGPHLHYEVHLPGGQPIDPLPWLASRGVDILRNTP
ncbi:M23 family metallopeptidase [Nocardia sp. CS682]|uniref:M23 family metallopeptidase n=1 Tax=Nocardia sp. CS682 TaxID=1047172 RepID=UPI0010752E52|nr:M23 family metallopeptidase [Nocardia sp. CS682]QBS38983.1 M23 family peptidase [Nocardia sp. CS682]